MKTVCLWPLIVVLTTIVFVPVLRADNPTREFFNAVNQGNEQDVEAYLMNGVHPDTRNTEGLTALMVTALEGNADLATLLLSYGADVNARIDDYNINALTLAAEHGPDSEIVGVLLEAGAEPKPSSDRGRMTHVVEQID